MKKYLILLITLFLSINLYFTYSVYKKNNTLPINKEKSYAALLVDKGLYEEAVSAYKKIFNSANISLKDRANIAYIIADIYKEKIYDYKKALSYYLRVSTLDPKGNIKNEAEKKTIECLERIGKSQEAQYMLDDATALDESQKSKKGEPIVKIGKRIITSDDIDKEIEKIPEFLRKQYETQDKRKEFMQQIIAQELVYNAAKRLNLNTDKRVLKKVQEFKKSSMIQVLMEDELKDKVKITSKEIELYYKANKEDFPIYDKSGKKIKGKYKTLDESKEDIQKILTMEKGSDVFNEYVSRLAQAEDIKFYKDIFTSNKQVQNSESLNK